MVMEQILFGPVSVPIGWIVPLDVLATKSRQTKKLTESVFRDHADWK